MDNDKLAIALLKELSRIDQKMLKLHVEIEDKKVFKSIDYGTRICFRDVIKEIPNFELYFSCELHKPINKNIHSLSLNISIYKEVKWSFDGFIDFDGFDEGYTNFSLEKEYKSLSNLIDKIEELYLIAEKELLWNVNRLLS